MKVKRELQTSRKLPWEKKTHNHFIKNDIQNNCMWKIVLNPIFISGWIIFSLIAGLMGTNKKLGFWGTFLGSLLISPLVTIIFMLVFQPKLYKN